MHQESVGRPQHTLCGRLADCVRPLYPRGMRGSSDQTNGADRRLLELKTVRTDADVLPEYRGTPVVGLLIAHNHGESAEPGGSASMVIITCMDFRLLLRIPEEGAFVIRTAGAAPEPALSNIAFAVAVAGLRTICIIGHTDCAMARIGVAAESFIAHMIETEGWPADRSRQMFESLQRIFAIDDPVAATWQRAAWLRQQFPSCLVAPLLYRVEDHALLQITSLTG